MKGLKVAVVGNDLPEDLDSTGFASPWAVSFVSFRHIHSIDLVLHSWFGTVVVALFTSQEGADHGIYVVKIRERTGALLQSTKLSDVGISIHLNSSLV